jgi:hypothetical protein
MQYSNSASELQLEFNGRILKLIGFRLDSPDQQRAKMFFSGGGGSSQVDGVTHYCLKSTPSPSESYRRRCSTSSSRMSAASAEKHFSKSPEFLSALPAFEIPSH